MAFDPLILVKFLLIQGLSILVGAALVILIVWGAIALWNKHRKAEHL